MLFPSHQRPGDNIRWRGVNLPRPGESIHQEQHEPEQTYQHRYWLTNRLLYTGSLPTTTNPIDNQRFYIWQQYGDFLANQPEPDENGLDFWTGNITGTCGTGFNDNNGCTHGKRIDVSRAFWAAAFPSLVINGGTQLTNNSEFVHRCYDVYLRRTVPDSDPGFQFWLSVLNSHGNPAGQSGIDHLIDAFTSSGDYRQRFGQP